MSTLTDTDIDTIAEQAEAQQDWTTVAICQVAALSATVQAD